MFTNALIALPAYWTDPLVIALFGSTVDDMDVQAKVASGEWRWCCHVDGNGGIALAVGIDAADAAALLAVLRDGQSPGSLPPEIAHRITPEAAATLTNHVFGVPVEDMAEVVAKAESLGIAIPDHNQRRYVWEHWQIKALCAGVDSLTAEVGRMVIREFLNHQWPFSLDSQVGPSAGDTMIAQALADPKGTEKRWSELYTNGPGVA
jgi:hypothetical protein